MDWKFFDCGWLSLLSTLQHSIKASDEAQNPSKIRLFEFRSFGLRGLGGRSEVGNKLV